MPQLLNHLGVDSVEVSLDWGTLAVYTCAADCVKDSAAHAYREEFLWKQDFTSWHERCLLLLMLLEAKYTEIYFNRAQFPTRSYLIKLWLVVVVIVWSCAGNLMEIAENICSNWVINNYSCLNLALRNKQKAGN